ncbi:hypothetical protein C3K47_17890 [Solitalea longa]|uniref:Lipocalin-like domain-containing protein n=1 Tax=Solitalea longa TaxID=2079460 RepID=A0A2S4ZX80_9SPHI|nr:hypothetical protein [Solitalea longa]POY34974.1 hypothetical protein C3K47_17890 [Solitalea longa]
MKKFAYLAVLFVGIFAAVACKKDDRIRTIDTTKLTSYIWTGNETTGISGYAMIVNGVSYDFYIDVNGHQVCKKTYYAENRDAQGYRTVTPYDFYGTWTLENNQVKIIEGSTIADHQFFNETFDILELNDKKLVFKPSNDPSRLGIAEREFNAHEKPGQVSGK